MAQGFFRTVFNLDCYQSILDKNLTIYLEDSEIESRILNDENVAERAERLFGGTQNDPNTSNHWSDVTSPEFS
jgi:hypothetical protein